MKELRGWWMNQRNKCRVKNQKGSRTFGLKPFWYHCVHQEMKKELVTQTDKGKTSQALVSFSHENVHQDGRGIFHFAGANSLF